MIVRIITIAAECSGFREPESKIPFKKVILPEWALSEILPLSIKDEASIPIANRPRKMGE